MKPKYSLLTLAVLLSLLIASTAFANVSYLGPAGTYTEEATVLFFGDKEPITPVGTVPEALSLVKSGQSQYAVVPIENTIGGPVYNYLDAVINDAELTVIGEINLPIRQTLLGLPGTDLKEIKTVMSHPQGLAQSKDWLKANLPQARLVEVSSTAEAAKRVSQGGDKTIAAIAASRTASVYSLEILANDIQYTDTNITRFWVVTLKKNQTYGHQRIALSIQGPAQDLPKVIADIQGKGYTLISLHDRAAKTKLGEYLYVVEVFGKDTASLEKIAQKYSSTLKIRVLGGFDAK